MIDKIFREVVQDNYKKNIIWEMSSNNLYFPENLKPNEDLKENTVISFYPHSKKNDSTINEMQFMKIGNSYYIISAP